MSEMIINERDCFFGLNKPTPQPLKFGVKEGLCLEGELHDTLKLNYDINSIPYYDITITYFEGNLCNYEDHIYMAKEPIGIYNCKRTNIGQFPPEYPIQSNGFWELIK